MSRKATTAVAIAGDAVKTLESKETRAFKENDGNAQFSLCCTSTAMPDDDSQDRHPAFCFWSDGRRRGPKSPLAVKTAVPRNYSLFVAIHQVVPPASFTPPRLPSSSFFSGS